MTRRWSAGKSPAFRCIVACSSQIHAGGRGKGGGVKVASSKEEVREYAEAILGMTLITHQTGPEGKEVKRLLVEEGAPIKDELYVGLVVDRTSQRVVVMASSEGGTEIETVAEETPEKIHKVHVDPNTGLTAEEAGSLADKIGIPSELNGQAAGLICALYQAFWDTDASLAEINPLILTGSGDVIALDAKLNFDSNALYRHPDVVEMRDLDEEDPAEVEASRFDLSYIQLDGNIGCLVNGAGSGPGTIEEGGGVSVYDTGGGGAHGGDGGDGQSYSGTGGGYGGNSYGNALQPTTTGSGGGGGWCGDGH